MKGYHVIENGKPLQERGLETRDVSKANETLKEMKDEALLGLVALTHD